MSDSELTGNNLNFNDISWEAQQVLINIPGKNYSEAWHMQSAALTLGYFISVTGRAEHASLIKAYAESPQGGLSGADDDLWHVLAYLRYADVASDPDNDSVRAEAVTLYNSVYNNYFEKQGGVKWNSTSAPFSISTSLMSFAGMILWAADFKNNVDYRLNSTACYNWLRNSGQVWEYQSDDTILIRDASADDALKWTYNQGMVLGSIVGLHRRTEIKTDPGLCTLLRNDGKRIANGIINHLSEVPAGSTSSILKEGPTKDNSSLNSDQQLFKGICMRYLAMFTKLLYDIDPNDTEIEKYKQYIINNATLVHLYRTNNGLVNAHWYDNGGGAITGKGPQLSGIDLFTAAYHVQNLDKVSWSSFSQ